MSSVFGRAVKAPAQRTVSVRSRLASNLQKRKETATSWYDAEDVNSVSERRALLQDIVVDCRQLTTASVESDDSLWAMSALPRFEKELNTLRDVESTFTEEKDLEHYLNLPVFTVHAGVPSDFQYGFVSEFDTTRQSALDTHWSKFCDVEPYFFVRENLDVQRDSLEMRIRAANHAEEKTSSVGDLQTRAAIIKTFVEGVEKERRDQVRH